MAGDDDGARAVERLGVLGPGTMVAGIAQVAAEAGLEVLLHDPLPGAVARGMKRIGTSTERRVERGKLTAADREATLARIHQATTVEGLATAQLVVEAIPDDLWRELKRERLLEAAAPTPSSPWSAT